MDQKLDAAAAGIQELQIAKAARMQSSSSTDIDHRASVFDNALGQYAPNLGSNSYWVGAESHANAARWRV
jgi:hypothetical protein